MGLGSSMELIFKAILDRSQMSTGLKALQGQIQTFTNSVKDKGIFGTIAAGASKSSPAISGLAGTLSALAGVGAAIGAGFGVAMNAVNGFVGVLKGAVEHFEKFETSTLQIARFTGSMKEAHKVMEELDNLGEELSTPDEQLAGAYVTLRLIGGEAIATSKNLRLIADAAAAGRGDVESLAQAFAIAQSSLESGDGLGRFGVRLARLGVISWEAKEAIDALSKSGQNAQALAMFTKEWDKFSGSAEMKGKTVSGAMERLKDSVEDLFKKLAAPFVGPLTEAIDTIANALRTMEPAFTLIGGVIGTVLAIVNTFVVGLFNAVDACFALTDAIESLFGSENAGKRLEARLEAIEKRTKALGVQWKSIFTGSLNPDQVPQTEQGNYQFDEGATEERVKNIAKLERDIADNKRKTAELVMDEEEKLAELRKESDLKSKEAAEARARLSEAEANGEKNIASLKEKALSLAKEESDLALRRAQTEKQILETKRKSAEQDAKRTQEIYKSIREGQERRDFAQSGNMGKYALNQQKRGELESQKAEILKQLDESPVGGKTPEELAETTSASRI